MTIGKTSARSVTKALNNDKRANEYLKHNPVKNEEIYLIHKSTLKSVDLKVFSLDNYDDWAKGKVEKLNCLPVTESRKQSFLSNKYARIKSLSTKSSYKVFKKRYDSYRKYTVTGEEGDIILLDHLILPISDFQYGDHVYRWIFFNSSLADGKYSFRYVLYKLDEDQQSLFDNNKISSDQNSRLSISNPLLKNSISRFISEDDRLFATKYKPKNNPMRLAEFEHNFSREYEKSLQASSYLKVFKSRRNSNEELLRDHEILINLAIVFKFIQDGKLSKRSTQRSLQYTSKMGVKTLF
ncbi:predicted protein [Scheffersomyces stipitis CBS 6054]|uniref:Uncharacterized protein n=1 Tax=Scheffersomyces stipitis (strain ATCC 58785 / CBS 6054 / NBRC 10063 / NRRL Y-11545) TaxID=322104 RepID=A3M016_PICST|nr:predicted protein [Scheffersomyces stipitis CBS 6054]ABN68637.2 predicted protein [Scheffersomyces stipitis CBS 6054]KAG2730898.1 hypothetical protein G9P44_006047 [Scheffersomyces stipitis]